MHLGDNLSPINTVIVLISQLYSLACRALNRYHILCQLHAEFIEFFHYVNSEQNFYHLFGNQYIHRSLLRRPIYIPAKCINLSVKCTVLENELTLENQEALNL